MNQIIIAGGKGGLSPALHLRLLRPAGAPTAVASREAGKKVCFPYNYGVPPALMPSSSSLLPLPLPDSHLNLRAEARRSTCWKSNLGIYKLGIPPLLSCFPVCQNSAHKCLLLKGSRFRRDWGEGEGGGGRREYAREHGAPLEGMGRPPLDGRTRGVEHASRLALA